MIFESLCDVCLTKQENLIDTSFTKIEEKSLKDLLTFCVPEIDWKSDEFSSLICEKCCNELKISVQFRKKCVESDIQRQNLLNKDYSKRIEDCNKLNNSINDETTDVEIGGKKWNCVYCKKDFLTEESYNVHFGKFRKKSLQECKLSENNDSNSLDSIKHCSESDSESSANRSSDDTKENLKTPFATIFPNTENYFPSKTDRKCKLCLKEFRKPATLLNHFRSKHSLENCYKCSYCNEAFPNKERLTRHENHHTGNRKYVCSTCGKKFFTSSDLFHHNERHSRERKFKCDICNVKSFTTRNNLRTHKVIVHTNPEEWKFLCTQCGRKCVTKGALKAHMKRHGDRKEFPCDLCGKGFCTKAELSKHLKAHSNRREHNCNICGQQYKLKEILERHMFRKHGVGDKIFPDRIKNYSCPVCPLKFSSKLQLEKHLRSHNGERPFKCEYCSHSFICSSYLKGHLKIKHPPLITEVVCESSDVADNNLRN